jgi:hypothetical protein
MYEGSWLDATHFTVLLVMAWAHVQKHGLSNYTSIKERTNEVEIHIYSAAA